VVVIQIIVPDEGLCDDPALTLPIPGRRPCHPKVGHAAPQRVTIQPVVSDGWPQRAGVKVARFPKLAHFRNVEEFAKQQGLIYDKHNQFDRIFPKDDRAHLAAIDSEVPGLKEHALTFKPGGSGNAEPVVVVSHPYASADSATREAVESYAAKVGLSVRFNEPGDRLRFAGDEVSLVFWRTDDHEIEAPLRH
jgi:hypothetical protein